MMKLNKYLEAKLTYFKTPIPPNILSIKFSKLRMKFKINLAPLLFTKHQKVKVVCIRSCINFTQFPLDIDLDWAGKDAESVASIQGVYLRL